MEIEIKKLRGLLMELLALVVISFWMGAGIEALAFFSCFIFLRSLAGGYHFESLAGKLVFVAGIWGVVMFLCNFSCPAWLLLLLGACANLIVFLLAPATNKEEPETDLEVRRVGKNKAFFASTGMMALAMAMRESVLAVPIMMALVVEALSVLHVLAAAIWQEKPDSAS